MSNTVIFLTTLTTFIILFIEANKRIKYIHLYYTGRTQVIQVSESDKEVNGIDRKGGRKIV